MNQLASDSARADLALALGCVGGLAVFAAMLRRLSKKDVLDLGRASTGPKNDGGGEVDCSAEAAGGGVITIANGVVLPNRATNDWIWSIERRQQALPEVGLLRGRQVRSLGNA